MPDWVVSISSPPKSSSRDSPTQPHTWTPALERHPRAMACTTPTPSPVWLGSFQVGLHGARPSLPRPFCPVLIQDCVCAHSAHSDPRLDSRVLLVCEQHSRGKNAVYRTSLATRLILTSASAFTGTCAGFPAITAGAGPWACAHNSAVQATPLFCIPSASRTPMAGHKAKNDILLWLVGLGLGCFVCLFVLTCFSFSYVCMLGGGMCSREDQWLWIPEGSTGVLGAQLRSSTRTVHILNHQAISPTWFSCLRGSCAVVQAGFQFTM